MFDRLQSPTPQCAPPQTRQHWKNTTNTTTQTHTHTHTNPACTRCPQCPSLKTITGMSVLRPTRECPQNKSTNCKQVTTHEHMTVEQLPYPCKKMRSLSLCTSYICPCGRLPCRLRKRHFLIIRFCSDAVCAQRHHLKKHMLSNSGWRAAGPCAAVRKKDYTYLPYKRGDVCSMNANLSTPVGTRAARCLSCVSMEDNKSLTRNTKFCAQAVTRDTSFTTPLCRKRKTTDCHAHCAASAIVSCVRAHVHQYSTPTICVRHVFRNCHALPFGRSDLWRNPVQLPKQIHTIHIILVINAHVPADLLSAMASLPQQGLQTCERDSQLQCCVLRRRF